MKKKGLTSVLGFMLLYSYSTEVRISIAPLQLLKSFFVSCDVPNNMRNICRNILSETCLAVVQY